MVRDPAWGPALARLGRRTLILVLFASSALVRADATQSATHVMQWEEGETIHIAGQRGAINRHRRADVEVEVFSTGRVIVSNAGTLSEHNLYADHSTDESTKWTNIWEGTWALAGDTMRLNLKLYKRTCERQKTQTGAAPQTLPCGAVGKAVRLSCQIGEVTMRDPGPPGPATRQVWTCTPDGEAALADTPTRWVLGKASCVKVIGGRGAYGYERCASRR